MEMNGAQWLELLAHIAMGIGLSACAGMRAFLPLLVVGIAGRFEWIPLSGSFEWLSGTPALIVFGAAVTLEILGDKIPVVDNFLDGVQTLVKPVAGALVTASVVTDWAPLYIAVGSIVLGGTLAGAVHLTKAKLRLVSTASTGGALNPVISVAEDAATAAASIGALFLPALVALGVLVVLSVAWYGFRSVKQRVLAGSPSLRPSETKLE